MRSGRFARQFLYSTIGVLTIMSARPTLALAQDDHAHAMPSAHRELTADQKKQESDLVAIVRDATARFQDVAVAQAEGYALQFGCVSGSDAGAMGLHFVNADLVNKGELDAAHPQIVLYEALSSGRLQLTGADYLVLADAWNATHAGPPELGGQLFHLFDAPNRFALPAFYTLHVWAWKENPNGTFVNWNPNVSCDAFNGQSR